MDSLTGDEYIRKIEDLNFRKMLCDTLIINHKFDSIANISELS